MGKMWVPLEHHREYRRFQVDQISDHHLTLAKKQVVRLGEKACHAQTTDFTECGTGPYHGTPVWQPSESSNG